VVIVFPIGVTTKGKYVTSSGAKLGGRIILTKSVAIEGTAILASDRNELLKKEFGEEFTKRCGRFLEKLSVTREALLSFEFGGVQAMHDPTEGGLAGGLNELTDASKLGFRVYEERIPVEPETERICRFFGIDPLRLISSGSLLIVADPESSKGISDRLEERGIRTSIIGEIVGAGNRTIIRKNGKEEHLPMPESDEIWKALSKAAK
jgi:hydrogenase maturation factor